MNMSFYLIIRGPLGSGKSTISEKLTQELNAKRFAVDDVLEEHNLIEDKEDGYISQKSFKKVNEIVETEARATLEKGTSVIFDGNFYWQSAIEDLISRLPYPHEVFTLHAPLEVCIERDSKRTPSHGEDATTVVFNKTMSFEYGVPIDATKSVEESVAEIKSKMSIELGIKTIKLASERIITLNDYPLYDTTAFKNYVDKSRRGESLPFIPVIQKETVKKYFKGALLEEFEFFEHKHPQVGYFMLDGSHRTTALTFTNRPIAAVVYTNDTDIVSAKNLIPSGQILGSGTLSHSFSENCEILNHHFTEKPYFMTVKEKTDKMIAEGFL